MTPISLLRASGEALHRSAAMVRSLALVSVVSLSAALPASALIVSTDVPFSVIYTATALPTDSDPVWQQLPAGAGGTAVVADNALTLTTPTVGSRYYRINNSNIWNGASTAGSTIEFSLKVDSLDEGATNSTMIYFSTGEKGYAFFFRPNEITYQAGANAPVHSYDTSVFNRYRITLSESGEASLYVNDASTALISGYMGNTLATSTNFIYFGDASNVAGGTVHWEYVAFTNAGAFAPVPEGSTAMLCLLGGGLLMGGIRLARGRKPFPFSKSF